MFQQRLLALWLLAITAHQDVILVTDGTRLLVFTLASSPLRRAVPALWDAARPEPSIRIRGKGIRYEKTLLDSHSFCASGLWRVSGCSRGGCAGDRVRRIGGTAFRGHSSVLNRGAAGGCPDNSGGAKFLTP